MNGFLIDFGVAKQLKEEDFQSTTTGVKGTLQYWAPELERKNRRANFFIDLFACDMWSLGVTIY